MAELVQYYGTGRRKTAIARVYLRPGSGEFKVNGRAFEEYFVTPAQRVSAKAPLVSTETAARSMWSPACRRRRERAGRRGKAGHCARSDAVQRELRKKLEAEGMVTRDSRGKERKKYGQKGARKRFQFSKR
jgi:small subunit ribosomal protein S9